MKEKTQKIFITLLCISSLSTAQYDPGSVHYGITLTKLFTSTSAVGAGVQVEYAYNCYTTFLGEYQRTFFLEPNETSGYNEFALGVNLIMFNWYPTTITGGIGYIGTDASFFDTTEDNAFLAFETGNFVHGIQIKMRILYQIVDAVHVYAAFNLKSIGRRYDTLNLGFSYNFDSR